MEMDRLTCKNGRRETNRGHTHTKWDSEGEAGSTSVDEEMEEQIEASFKLRSHVFTLFCLLL